MFRFAAKEDHDAHARRAMRLLPVYAGMLTAVQSKGAVANLSEFPLYVAMRLLLDRGGVSDALIAELRRLGVCAGPDTARRAIHKASLSLTAQFVMARPCRPPPRPARPALLTAPLPPPHYRLTTPLPPPRLALRFHAGHGVAS